MDVLEAAHAEAADLEEWAGRTAEAGQLLLDAPNVTLSVAERHADHYAELVRAGGGMALFRNFDGVPLEVGDCLYRIRQVARPIELAPHMPAPFREHWAKLAERTGMHGGGGVMGYVDRICFALYGYTPHEAELGSKDRALLRQVAAHVEAGLALHLRKAKEVAVLRPDGRVEHAEGLARESASQKRLTSHVRGVESVRTRSKRRAPSALDTWTALVNGSWGLVERIDTDGKRFYVIVESPAGASRFRALTPNETRVLELSARGVSGKSAAYALGVSASAISQTLQSAALKIGCRNRTELVYAASLLLGPTRDERLESRLTAAERDVLSLVRGGFSNAEIAARRATSERTVSNQVARLLKKTNAPSRRVLAATARSD